MATISTTLELVDRMSGRLTAIAGRVQALADEFMQLDGCIGSVQARMEALGMKDFQIDAPEPALPGIGKMEAPERVMAVESLAVTFAQQAVQPEMQVAAAKMMTALMPAEIPLPEPEIRIPVAETPLPRPEMRVPAAEMPPLPMPEMRIPAAEMPSPELEMRVPAAEMPPLPMPEIRIPAAEMTPLPVPETPGIQTEIAAEISGDGAGFLRRIAEKIQLQQGMLAAAARAAANAAVSAVQRAMQPAVGAAIGMQFAEGLAQGIRSRIASVAAAARAAANAASAGARTALDIHSPSRAAEEIGAYFGAGFAEGINASGSTVSKAAGRLSGIAYRELDAQLWSGIRFFDGLEQTQHEPGAEKVYLSERDAQRVRELAEREAVKTFTTAELNIAFTANNSIDSKMDLDGVVAYLEEQVAEKLSLAAEGVYA